MQKTGQIPTVRILQHMTIKREGNPNGSKIYGKNLLCK